MFAILILLYIASIIQHWIFKTPFVTDRTAIYYIPLVMLLLVLIFKTLYITVKENRKMYLQAVGLTLLFALTINFFSNMNLSYTYAWKYDSDTKDILTDIELIHQATPQAQLYIWNNWKLMPSINYLKHTESITWLPWSKTLPPTSNYNVYILLPGDEVLIEAYSLQIIKEYEDSGAVLAIKSYKPKATTPSLE